jgi:hypothetical protein
MRTKTRPRHGPRRRNALGYDIAEKATFSFRQKLVASSYRSRIVSANEPNRAFDLSIFRIEIVIEIDKGCSILSKIETEITKARSSMSIFMPIFVSIFLHEIDKASSTWHEIAIEIDKLINIK